MCSSRSTASRARDASTIDSVDVASRRAGSLSAALAAATRAAVLAAPDADSIELVIVSPFAREEIDEATARLRAAWPGRIHLAPGRGNAGREHRAARRDAREPERRRPRRARAHGGRRRGGIRAARARQRSPRRTRRGRATAGTCSCTGPRPTPSVVGAARVDRRHRRRDVRTRRRSSRAFRASGCSTARPVARWADGEPAAVEHAVGAGCIRDVGVLLDQASDLTLREPFRRFAASLLVPCGGTRSSRPIDQTARAALAGSGSLAREQRRFRDRAAESSRWTPWLLALGALLLIVELAVRRPIRGCARHERFLTPPLRSRDARRRDSRCARSPGAPARAHARRRARRSSTRRAGHAGGAERACSRSPS